MCNMKITDYVTGVSTTIVEAMKKIDSNSEGVLFIINNDGILIGSLTDGDIRRWIIKTGNLSAKVSQVMNDAPRFLKKENKNMASLYMREHFITAVPILEEDGRISEIIFSSDNISGKSVNKEMLNGNPVVIMAGGKGTRLYPYTKILPKPLIPIGDIPIIERIIESFCDYGISEYYLTVNYKKEMIKSYFSELNPAYTLHYVEEDKPLGTAGSIRLIQDKFEKPVIVTNCDILIRADYGAVLRHHKEVGNVLTVVSALKESEIPYGVLHSKEKGIITHIEEKPSLSYFVNTGMYILEPELIKKIPKDIPFHMTDLITLLMDNGLQVGMYPVSADSFLDMGEFEEMKRMEEHIKEEI